MSDAKSLPESDSKDDGKKPSQSEVSKIARVLVDKNPKIFHGLKQDQKDNILRTVTSIIVSKNHSGPLPDAETLREYAEIIPNGAERVMAMAEKEQNHRHDHNNMIVNRTFNQSSTGQVFGFILCLLTIGGGIFLCYTGANTAGIAAILTALATLVGAFAYTKYQENK